MINTTSDSDIEAIREDIAEIGDNISLMSTLVRTIEISLSDDFTFDKSDTENLLFLLNKSIDEAQEAYNRIDGILIL